MPSCRLRAASLTPGRCPQSSKYNFLPCRGRMDKTQSPVRHGDSRDSCFSGDVPGMEEHDVVSGVPKPLSSAQGQGPERVPGGSGVYLAAAGSRSRWRVLQRRTIKAQEISSLLRRARERRRSLQTLWDKLPAGSSIVILWMSCPGEE